MTFGCPRIKVIKLGKTKVIKNPQYSAENLGCARCAVLELITIWI